MCRYPPGFDPRSPGPKATTLPLCCMYSTNTLNYCFQLPNGALEPEKPAKLFDMKKFQQNVSRELKRSYPDRRKLECQCICSIAFVKNEQGKIFHK